MSIVRLTQAAFGLLALSFVSLDISYSQSVSLTPQALSAAQTEVQGQLGELKARTDRLFAELTAEKITLQIIIQRIAEERKVLDENRFSSIEALGVQISKVENPAITLRLSELERSTKETLWRISDVDRAISAVSDVKLQIDAMISQAILMENELKAINSIEANSEELKNVSVSLNILRMNVDILNATLVAMTKNPAPSSLQLPDAPMLSGIDIKKSIDDIWDPAKTWGVQ